MGDAAATRGSVWEAEEEVAGEVVVGEGAVAGESSFGQSGHFRFS